MQLPLKTENEKYEKSEKLWNCEIEKKKKIEYFDKTRTGGEIGSEVGDGSHLSGGDSDWVSGHGWIAGDGERGSKSE